uniref:Uncharacterized protein n=1 Tax=Meloidogyne enterolobii TaxID=390850 RepID=A0A6V7TKM4_MELEN|nr:unnamed protein product [Meloidogyne enterolobii]
MFIKNQGWNGLRNESGFQNFPRIGFRVDKKCFGPGHLKFSENPDFSERLRDISDLGTMRGISVDLHELRVGFRVKKRNSGFG